MARLPAPAILERREFCTMRELRALTHERLDLAEPIASGAISIYRLPGSDADRFDRHEVMRWLRANCAVAPPPSAKTTPRSANVREIVAGLLAEDRARSGASTSPRPGRRRRGRVLGGG